MTRRRQLAALIATLGLLAAVVPAAQAAVTAKASVETAKNVTRVVVTLSGVKGLKPNKRPTAVTAKSGALTFKLRKVSATKWQSAGLGAPVGAAVKALSGKKIQVIVRSKGGSITLRPVLTVPATGGITPGGTTPGTTPPPSPLPPGAQPLFGAPPAQNLTGTPAFDHFKQYFLNSRFTDCPNGGWPNCSVEEKYDHCPDGSWSYFRITPSSGSDINSVGSYQVTGAEAKTDGSWGVEYISQLGSSTSYSFYSWSIAANGSVTGRYWSPGTSPANGDPPSQLLSNLVWVRPVNCGQKL
jgi:hypothetical protein